MPTIGSFSSIDSKNAMLGFRQQGYSNREIAKKMFCSYETVLKVIGKENRALLNQNAQPPVQPIVHQPTKNEDNYLLIDNRITKLVGSLAQYEIDSIDKHVSIIFKEKSIDNLSYEDVETLINELKVIASNVKQINGSGINAWFEIA